MDEKDVSEVRTLAASLLPQMASVRPAIALAALELACARMSLEMEDPDDHRAAAAELFEAAAATDLEELAARNLTPWAGSPWDDEPIPYELTNCPICEQPIPCACELP